MKIKAINTKYKGYTFRSRLEARWAVYFESLGIEWEYENRFYANPGYDDEINEEWFDDIDIHVSKAKSKRFEHYEKEVISK